MNRIDKNNPSQAWIDSIRTRYPCEQEIDRVLTRKLLRRAGPAYAPVSLERLVSGLKGLLKKELNDPFEIREARWLTGGASKLQVAIRLDWVKPGVGRTETPMVIRMEPAESIVETSRLREFELIRAVNGVLPVPPVYWIDTEGEYFPYPAIVYGFAEGVAKPTGVISNVTGLGINYGTDLRPKLAEQYVDHLALLHTWDWRGAALDSFDKPVPGVQAVEWHLNWWERVWEEDVNRDVPLMRLTASWLRENMPATEHLSIQHGDYRAGNFLFDERQGRITSWLDWELAHIGDYHEDVAYTLLPYLGHSSEDGAVLLVSGMMSHEALCERYQKSSGLTLNPKTLDYYLLFQAYKAAVIILASSYRPARNAKTHQDLLLTWIMGLGYSILDFIRDKLEEIA